MMDLSGRVAIITGAGGGLGRAHALLLAKRGAKIVVNDFGGAVDGSGGSSTAAERVVAEITAAGGEAVANSASVTDAQAVQDMVEETLTRWGKVDILVNNAGILRDKSFSNMSFDDFRAVMDVHFMGAVHCTKALWDHMKAQNYGRIVMTTSCSGLYGNFGQTNYAAAKMALVGLMQSLALEGEKYNIKVNCLAPSAATRMLEGLLPAEALKALAPEAVSPAVLALVSEQAPTRKILLAGAGAYEQANITMTKGIFLGMADAAADQITQNWDAISARADEMIPSYGFDQAQWELKKAGYNPDQ